jgi:hypothetical protein
MPHAAPISSADATSTRSYRVCPVLDPASRSIVPDIDLTVQVTSHSPVFRRRRQIAPQGGSAVATPARGKAAPPPSLLPPFVPE